MINFANDFELFNNKNLGSVRTALDHDGNIWFVAKDVCDVLGIVNNRDAMSRLDDDDEKDVVNTDTLGGTQKANIISKQVSNLQENKRKLRKQVNNLNEYADLYEDLFEKAQADYVAAMEENEYLRDKVEKLRHPEDYPVKNETSQKYFVMSDGRVSFAGKEDFDFER